MSLFVVSFSIVVEADEWHQGLLATCDKDKGTYKIEYLHAYNDKGLALYKQIDRESNLECTLGDDLYSFKPKSHPGSPDYMGRCGSFNYLTIEVVKNGNIIFSKDIISDCHYAKDHITSVEFHKNTLEPTVIKKLGTP
jgi:hypothetical protein